MGRGEPTRTMKCRLARDRSVTPSLSQRARERSCYANFMVSEGGRSAQYAGGSAGADTRRTARGDDVDTTPEAGLQHRH